VFPALREPSTRCKDGAHPQANDPRERHLNGAILVGMDGLPPLVGRAVAIGRQPGWYREFELVPFQGRVFFIFPGGDDMDDDDDDDNDSNNLRRNRVMVVGRVLATQVGSFIGESVFLQGWVHSYRRLGGVAFLVLRDRSGLVQCVLEGAAAGLAVATESVVGVNGAVVGAPKAVGGVEVRVASLDVISAPTLPLPFELNKKELQAGIETVLAHRSFGLRHPKQGAVLKVAAEQAHAFREYLRGEGFTEVRTPKIVAMGAEGGSALFPVDYYGEPAFLAQSPQLYKQMLVAAGYERVFEVGPAYRAEEHNTSRHLAEFTSLDVEVGFIQSMEDVMNLETELLRHIFLSTASRCGAELSLWGAAVPEVPAHIERMPIVEAQAILLRRFGKISPVGDLDTEGERLICQFVGEQQGGSFVFLTDYPVMSKPFYIWPNPQNPGVACGFDLLFNGQEITSGGQRVHVPTVLTQNLAARGLAPEQFAPYLEALSQGCPPHGGFAIGLERLTALTLGVSNVREASAFPRDRQRLVP
jgi:nondiscriminating aspartyl-tRNA synthetase